MTREINILQVRESIREFLAVKVKKTYEPFQTLGRKLLNLSDTELTEWCCTHNCPIDFHTYVYVNGVAKEIAKSDRAKYDRLCRKVENGDDLTEAEINFAEEYEAMNGIEDTIV